MAYGLGCLSLGAVVLVLHRLHPCNECNCVMGVMTVPRHSKDLPSILNFEFLILNFELYNVYLHNINLFQPFGAGVNRKYYVK